MKYAFTAGVVIFVVALGVRFLTWQDNRHEIWKVQTAVTERYKQSASQLLAGDFKTFVSDINHEAKYGALTASDVINVQPGADHVFRVPVKLEQGRVLLKVTDVNQEKVLASMVVDLVEGPTPEGQPVTEVAIPFVSGNESQVRLVITNYAVPHSVAFVGPGKLIELGPSSYQWLRYFRIPIGLVQRIFKTAWMLPLVVIGLLLLMWERRWPSLLMILIVPLYYLTVQSTVHTERRYVYIVHYFFLILAAHAIAQLILLLARRRGRKPQTAD